MPALEVLHLKNSFPEICDIRDVEHIKLPNLQHLSIISPTGLSNILSVIAVPVETLVSQSQIIRLSLRFPISSPR